MLIITDTEMFISKENTDIKTNKLNHFSYTVDIGTFQITLTHFLASLAIQTLHNHSISWKHNF